MDRLSERCRRVIDVAQHEARQLEHPHVGTEHLLLGLIAVEGPAHLALVSAGATKDATRTKVAEAVGQRSAQTGDRELSTRARRALDRASRLSLHRRDPEVEPEHLLVGVLDVEGRAGQVLRGLGVDVAALRSAVDLSAKDVHTDSGRASSPIAAVPPHCAVCGAGLDPGLVYRLVTADDDHGRSRSFTVTSCSACGAAISATPA